MSKTKQQLALLETLINQCRKDKLMYLNTADKQDLPTFKRFFNQQAILRNRMFNDFSSLLSEFNINAEDVLLKRPDLKQLMMTTPKREKNNPFVRCLKQDLLFKKNLEALIGLDVCEKNNETYVKHLDKINACIAHNELHSVEVYVNDYSSPASELF